eukprot:TRINITY_DN6603_c0_g1_i1.p1 TRINITY_DN6603_c0_g1~~TRINITY_DN6603_c0_g1_i1.p1  ORF type:complete len:562 (-),score=173.43 TRINITY_DN6603_c0_g1_i1:720-2405(-)
MHLEALMQLPYLSDAVSPGDQVASISPLCSPQVLDAPPVGGSKFPFQSSSTKDDDWSVDYNGYFPNSMDTLPVPGQVPNVPNTTTTTTTVFLPGSIQRSQPQEIMNTFDEAFFNAFTDGLTSCGGVSNGNNYGVSHCSNTLEPPYPPLESSFPSPPRSGYSSPAIHHPGPHANGSTEDYAFHPSSFDPYFLPVPEDPQEEEQSPYDYYPLTKCDSHMDRLTGGQQHHLEEHSHEDMNMDSHSLGSSQLPGSPDSTIKEELLEPLGNGCEDSGTYTCFWVDCGEEFENQGRLVDHVNGVHMETKKGCEELPCLWNDCPRQLKPFNAKYKLLTHMRVHTREKPYKCNFENCDRAFARLENKKIHFRSHTGQKPFNCKYSKEFNCTKKFSNSSDRAKHEQTHKDPKPYRCEVLGCCKRYTDPSSLRKHVKSHSQEEQVQYRKAKDLANAAKRTASPSNKSPMSPLPWHTPSSEAFLHSEASSPPLFPKFAPGINETPLSESILSSPEDAIMYTTTTSVAQNIRRQDPLLDEDMKCHPFDPLAFRYDQTVDCGNYDLHPGNWCSS